MRDIILGILIAIVGAELLDVSRWCAESIVRWAGSRWRDRSGVDHTREWLDDLKERPTSTLRLITALWIAFGAVIPPEWLTLNLPSLWQMTQPYRRTAAEIRDVLFTLVRARLGSFRSEAEAGRLHLIAIRAVASLLPEGRRDRYFLEWRSELLWMPRNARSAFCVSLLMGSPRLAIALRLARSTR